MRHHHQHRLGIDRGLGVVALLEAPARGGHDARLFVGEVDLVAALGRTRRRLRVGPTRLLALFALALALGAFGLVVLLLDGLALARTLLDLGLGLRDGAQALLAPRDLSGYVQPVIDRTAVAVFGQLQQLLHFCAQLGLDPVGMLPGQRLVLARVGRDLGAVQRDVAQLQALHLACQHQHLHEQRFDLRQEAPAEGGDAVVVGLRVRGNEAKRHRVVTGPLDLAAGVHPAGVTVHEQAQQHRGVVRIAAASGVLPNQLAQIQLVDDFDDKTGQVILRQPFVHRRRQQVRGVSIYSNEAAHSVNVRCNSRNCPSCRLLRVAG